MISARALGLLSHLASNGLLGGVKALSGVFTEGRDALYSAMNELKRAGLVRQETQTIGSRYCTVTVVTEEGYNFLETRMRDFLETRNLLQQSPHNGILTSNSILSKKLTKSTEQVREGYSNTLTIGVDGVSFLGQMDMDWEDINEQRRKDKAVKRKEYEDEKAKHADKKYKHRNEKPLADWSVSDMTFEFASRVQRMWHIPPWRVADTRFAFAFADFQKKFGTTPEIEIKLIDLFFAKYEHETSITDPDLLWRMFIKQAPSMLEDAKRANYSDSDMVEAKEDAGKSWEGI